MIGFDGSVADGRSGVRDHLEPIFAHHPTAASLSIVRATRGTGGARVLLPDVGVAPPGAAEITPRANAGQTMVARAKDGTRRVELFQPPTAPGR